MGVHVTRAIRRFLGDNEIGGDIGTRPHHANVRIGEGYDVEILNNTFQIPISSFHQDRRHAGRKLYQLLLDAMEHRKPVEQRQVIETAEFINRTDRTP